MVGRGWEVGAGGGRWGSGVITAGESRGGRGGVLVLTHRELFMRCGLWGWGMEFAATGG